MVKINHLLTAAAVFCFVLTTAAQAQPSGGDAVAIGISSALTGNAASYGVDVKNAIVFANEKLAHGKYKLIIEDDKCRGKDGVNTAHKLINVAKVKFVLGFACSSVVLSTAPLYEKAGVLIISSSAASPAISNAGEYIFRTWLSDSGSSNLLFEHVSSRHRVFGVISEQSDFPQNLFQAFEGNNKRNRLTIFNENFISDTRDFRSLLLRLRSKKVQGLFINTQAEINFLAILKQVKEMNWDVPIYGVYNPGTRSFLETAGELADGIVYVDMPSSTDVFNDEGKKMLDEFTSRFGKPNSREMIIATTFEAFRAIHLAIESGQQPLEYLNNAKFDGVFGKWWFDQNGDIQGIGFDIRRIQNGKSYPLL